MLPGLYTSASSLVAGQRNQEVIAQNLAHANSPGYRRQFLVQSADVGSFGRSKENPRLSRINSEELGVDFSSGGTEPTGRPLDVAISGEGFFELEGPNSSYYTRNGSFQVNQQGELVSSTGMVVAGEGGPIKIGSETAPGTITIDNTGNVIVDGASRGKIKVVQFDDKRSLTPVGSTAFSATTSPTTASDVQLLQGHREMSNVRTVDELVGMIVGMRRYQAAEKTLQAIGDSLKNHIET